MGLKVSLYDAKTARSPIVTEYGQMVVGNVSYNDIVNETITASTVGDVINLIEPEDGRVIIIDTIIASASRAVSGTDGAKVDLFPATEAEKSATTGVISVSINKNDTVVFSKLNLKIDNGLFYNVTADDSVVSVSVLFYRLPVEKV